MTDTILMNIFDDPRWRHIGRRLLHAEIDGKKRGAVLATWNQQFGNYALNRGEMERLVEAKRGGKLDEAHVVATIKNRTYRFEYRGAVDAETLNARQQAHPRRQVRGVLDVGVIRPRGQGRAVVKKAISIDEVDPATLPIADMGMIRDRQGNHQGHQGEVRTGAHHQQKS